MRATDHGDMVLQIDSKYSAYNLFRDISHNFVAQQQLPNNGGFEAKNLSIDTIMLIMLYKTIVTIIEFNAKCVCLMFYSPVRTLIGLSLPPF